MLTVTINLKSNKTMYVWRNTEARSRNHRWRGSITYSERESAAC